MHKVVLPMKKEKEVAERREILTNQNIDTVNVKTCDRFRASDQVHRQMELSDLRWAFRLILQNANETFLQNDVEFFSAFSLFCFFFGFSLIIRCGLCDGSY